MHGHTNVKYLHSVARIRNSKGQEGKKNFTTYRSLAICVALCKTVGPYHRHSHMTGHKTGMFDAEVA